MGTMRVQISMEEKRVYLNLGEPLFPRRHLKPFQLFALLAYVRNSQSSERGWVSTGEIEGLPAWRGKSRHEIGNKVGRYIQDLVKRDIMLIEAETLWRGPYRLQVLPENITFDIALNAVKDRLGLLRPKGERPHEMLLTFVEGYCRAASLFLQGWLTAKSGRRERNLLEDGRRSRDAWSEFCTLADNNEFDPALRLLAIIAAVRVADRLGRFKAVKQTILYYESLVKDVDDPAIVARYWLTRAVSEYRAGEHETTRKAIGRAKLLAVRSRDLALNGAIEDLGGRSLSILTMESLFEAKRPFLRYTEALRLLIRGLESRLLTDNFDAIQASCFNIGNTLQRMGEEHYLEAERWIQLSMNICGWMNLGRYDALSEVVLAKMALDLNDSQKFEKRIEAAERLALRIGNIIDESWCYILRALYSQNRNRREEVIHYLVEARKIYRAVSHYNWKTQEYYVKGKFSPELWRRVEQAFRAQQSNERQR